MPANPVTRFLLGLVAIVVGGSAMYFGFNRYPMGFTAGTVLATAGALDLMHFGRNTNR